MALSDKNIVITPNIGSGADPKIAFTGADSGSLNSITLSTYPQSGGILSFDGAFGQVFSMSGTGGLSSYPSVNDVIFSVNDLSGIPSFQIFADGTIKFAPYATGLSGSKFSLSSINFTNSWSDTPSTGTGIAEISNDTNVYKRLMIVGNSSIGSNIRRVGIWDRLTIATNNDSGNALTVGGIGYASTDFRAPMFVDSNNTAYKVDPDGTSIVNDVKVASITAGPRINASTFGANQTGLSGTFPLEVRGATVAAGGLGQPFLTFHYENNASRFLTLNSSGIVQLVSPTNEGAPVFEVVNGSIRSPIYYDSVDQSNYYLDLNGTSRIGGIQISAAENTTTGNQIRFYGIASDGQGSYDHTGIIERQFGTQDQSELLLYHGNDGSTGATADRLKLATSGRIVFHSINSGSATLNQYLANSTYAAEHEGSLYIDGKYMFFPSESYLGRASHSSGYFVGSYNSVGENSTKTNPIYTIGSNYLPTDTALGNMYGVGYSHSNFFGPLVTAANNTGWGFYVAGNGALDAVIGSNYSWFGGSVRSPLFYDSDNTGYYLNPESASNIHTLNTYYLANIADVGTDHPYGMYFANSKSSAYAIFRESGAWVHPYPNLRIAFHTGISIGANASYGGTTFYTDYDMVTPVLSVNSSTYGGAYNVYSHGNFYAPLIYDANDTSYYLDPHSTSRINNIYIGTKDATAPNAKMWMGPSSSQNYIESGNGAWDGSAILNITGYNGTKADSLYLNFSTIYWQDYATFNNTNGIYLNNGWYRTYNGGGWYNETYGGGIHMTDTTWVRVYNGKNFYTTGIIRADTDMRSPIYYDQNATGYYTDPASTSNLNALTVASIQASGRYLSSSSTIDMSDASYNTNTFYPVKLPIGPGRFTTFRIQNALNSNVPVWSDHQSGFTLHVEWVVCGSGWGTVANLNRRILHYHERFVKAASQTYPNGVACGGITQLTNPSWEIIYLRGGGTYYLHCDNNVTPEYSAGSVNYIGSQVSYNQTAAVSSGIVNDVWSSATNTPAYSTMRLVGGGTNSDPTLNVYSTSGDSFSRAAHFINSGMGTGQNNIALIGKENATKNSGYIGFNYSGTSGSDANFLTLGVHSVDNVLNIFGAGRVAIGTTTLQTQKFYVEGAAKFNGSLNLGSSWVGGSNVSEGYYQDSTNGAYRALNGAAQAGYFFQTHNGVSTSMYVGLTGTYAGRVGINTVAPDTTLHMRKDQSAYTYLKIENQTAGATSAGAGIRFDVYGGGVVTRLNSSDSGKSWDNTYSISKDENGTLVDLSTIDWNGSSRTYTSITSNRRPLTREARLNNLIPHMIIDMDYDTLKNAMTWTTNNGWVELNDSSNFPDAGIVKIDSEYIYFKFNDRLNNRLLISERGVGKYDGTGNSVAATHVVNSNVYIAGAVFAIPSYVKRFSMYWTNLRTVDANDNLIVQFSLLGGDPDNAPTVNSCAPENTAAFRTTMGTMTSFHTPGDFIYGNTSGANGTSAWDHQGLQILAGSANDVRIGKVTMTDMYGAGGRRWHFETVNNVLRPDLPSTYGNQFGLGFIDVRGHSSYNSTYNRLRYVMIRCMSLSRFGGVADLAWRDTTSGSTTLGTDKYGSADYGGSMINIIYE